MSCSATNSKGELPWDTVEPAATPALRLSVVVIITVLVGILYILIYVQLLYILWRRLWFMIISYQTAFLFVNLLWASLRLSLYTVYFAASSKECCELVFDLPDTFHWLLVNFPTFLQFLSLALLVHYFVAVVLQGLEWRYNPSSYLSQILDMIRWVGNISWSLLIVGFLAFNVTLGFILARENNHKLLITRLLVSEILFLIMAILLSLSILITYTTRYGRALSEIQSTWKKIWAVLISLALSILFISRCIYNIVSVAHGSRWQFTAGWNLPSDQADYEWNSKYGYVSYLIALICWEVIPTYLVVIFFRVKFRWPKQSNDGMSEDLDVRSSFFFSNPRRYESVEGDSFPYQRSAQVNIPQIPPSRAGYSYNSVFSGPATGRQSTNSSYQTGPMPGTTPPKLFANRSPLFSDH